jgi:hypothetical protein
MTESHNKHLQEEASTNYRKSRGYTRMHMKAHESTGMHNRVSQRSMETMSTPGPIRK